MKRVLIIHGWGGSDLPHWQAYLAQELVLEGHIVVFPQLPDRDNPSLKEWLKAIKKAYKTLKPQIVVCHSLGCIAWLHAPKSVKKLFLVAPPDPWENLAGLEDFFPLRNFETKAARSFVIASDNDEYISLERTKKLASKLDAQLITIKNGGHLNAAGGFGKWGFIKDRLFD